MLGLELRLVLVDDGLELRPRKLARLLADARKAAEDLVVGELIGVGLEVLLELLDGALVGSERRDAEGDVPVVLDLVRGAKALAELLDHELALPLLLDEADQEAEDLAEALGRDGGVGGEGRHDVGEQIVHGRRALLCKLGEEELRGGDDRRRAVDQAERHLGHLPLDLEHVVEDEVGEHHEHRLAHRLVGVAQVPVQVRRPRLEQVGVAHCEVSERDGNVGAHCNLGFTLHDGEEALELRFAEVRGGAHELAQREHRARAQRRREGATRVGADGAHERRPAAEHPVGPQQRLAECEEFLGVGLGGCGGGAQLSRQRVVRILLLGLLGGGRRRLAAPAANAARRRNRLGVGRRLRRLLGGLGAALARGALRLLDVREHLDRHVAQREDETRDGSGAHRGALGVGLSGGIGFLLRCLLSLLGVLFEGWEGAEPHVS